MRKVGAVALLLVSFALAALVVRFQPQVRQHILSLGLTAYPLAIGIFALVASAPFSVTDALAVMNGALFGPVLGSVVNAIGLVLAALLGYWINRRASHLLDIESALRRLPPWVQRLKVGSPGFLLAVRLFPGFGGTVATATAAAYKVPIWRHVWTMCAIAIPICTLLAIGGDRVTVLVHHYEVRARVYIERHRPHMHLRFHIRFSPKPTPVVLPTP
ncbi:MAG: VTT domain-containing protein [Vulcanimicrobiaceae bacterium]